VVKIIRLQKMAKVKTRLSQQDIRTFVTRFKHLIPGLESIPQDQASLNAIAQLLQVFGNNREDLMRFFFQLKQYLDGLDEEKKI